MQPIPPSFRQDPIRIADETWMVRQLTGGDRDPVHVYVNSLVIRGSEPVIVDAGGTSNRESWLSDVFSLVDPKDVRWVFISHDDVDHTGNLGPVLELCPNATLITSWFMVERLSTEMALPVDRMRWLNDGETFSAGDRELLAIRPPIYDSPTTRGLFDTKTGVYWASDASATPVPEPVDNVADLHPEMWREGFLQFQRILAPWHAVVSRERFAPTVRRIEALDITTLASGHSPVACGDRITQSMQMMYELPAMPEVDLPGQAELEAMVAAMTQEVEPAAASVN